MNTSSHHLLIRRTRFAELLLPLLAAILDESDVIDSRVVDRHPFFAASIAYAASTCVPGQQSIRNALWTKIRPWMHALPFSDRESDEIELINLNLCSSSTRLPNLVYWAKGDITQSISFIFGQSSLKPRCTPDTSGYTSLRVTSLKLDTIHLRTQIFLENTDVGSGCMHHATSTDL